MTAKLLAVKDREGALQLLWSFRLFFPGALYVSLVSPADKIRRSRLRNAAASAASRLDIKVAARGLRRERPKLVRIHPSSSVDRWNRTTADSLESSIERRDSRIPILGESSQPSV